MGFSLGEFVSSLQYHSQGTVQRLRQKTKGLGMAWIVGIDEAGYGPNLGPFVMSSVACRIPDDCAALDLWDVFSQVACRHSDPPGERFVVADSKLVYSQA